MKFDFAANKTVDSIEKVPADFRGLYSEGDDGSFSLRSDDAGVQSAVSAITRLNNALVSSRAEAKAAKDNSGVDLSALEDYGVTPEEIATTVAGKLEELQAQITSGKGKKSAEEVERQIEKIKKDLMKTHQTEVDAKEVVIGGLRGHLHKTLISDAATREIAAAGGDAEMLMPFVAPTLKPFESDGKYGVNVIDPEDGSTRYSGVTGEPMTIAERVAELKATDKFTKLFSSEAPSGGGTPPNGRKSPQAPKGQELTPVQKISSGLSKGLASKAGATEKVGAGVR